MPMVRRRPWRTAIARGPRQPEQTPKEQASLTVGALYWFAALLRAIPWVALVTLLATDAVVPFLGCRCVRGWNLLPHALHGWLGMESVYLVLSRVTLLRAPKYTLEPERFSTGDRLKTWRACLRDPTITASEFITGWFYVEGPQSTRSRPALASLRRGNVVHWLSWSLFCATPTDLSLSQQAELEAALRMLEARIGDEQAGLPFERLVKRWLNPEEHRDEGGVALTADGALVISITEPSAGRFRFPEGWADEVRSMRINLDAPGDRIWARPLFYYAITDGVIGGLVTPSLMRARGFTRHRQGSLTYWFREGSGGNGSGGRTPLVFVHGVGLGPLPYLGFISRIGDDETPMLVPEIPWVSQRLPLRLGPAPSSSEVVDDLATALHGHGIRAATFVGHSLGSVYVAWVARLRPQLLASAVFIDPIVFMLHHHKVAKQFLYEGGARTSALSTVERYFVKSEQRIVSYFQKNFFWYANNLWANNLAFPTAVILSDKDSIVPVRAVQRYFKFKPWVRLEVLQGATHGAFLAEDHCSSVVERVHELQNAGWRRAGVAPPLVEALQRRWRRPHRLWQSHLESWLQSWSPPGSASSSPFSALWEDEASSAVLRDGEVAAARGASARGDSARGDSSRRALAATAKGA